LTPAIDALTASSRTAKRKAKARVLQEHHRAESERQHDKGGSIGQRRIERSRERDAVRAAGDVLKGRIGNEMKYRERRREISDREISAGQP